MLTKVNICTPLKCFTNGQKEITIDSDSYFNLFTNLNNCFPDLRKLTYDLGVNRSADMWFLVDGKPLPIEELFLPVRKNAKIVLVPIISGSGGEFGSIVLGLALVAVGVFLLQPQIAFAGAVSLSGAAGLGAVFSTAGIITSFATGFISLGASLVLGGLMGAILGPTNKQNTQKQMDSNIRADNSAFGPLQNTTSTQTAVPLVFGLTRVPGQFIGGRVRTINHDAYTVISVANYV